LSRSFIAYDFLNLNAEHCFRIQHLGEVPSVLRYQTVTFLSAVLKFRTLLS